MRFFVAKPRAVVYNDSEVICMNKIGLVLQGGGARGAYQTGVWRALNEFCVTEHINGVSGASVGALNGAIFATGEYATAERIWENISPDQVFKKNSRLIINIINFLDKIDGLPKSSDGGAVMSMMPAAASLVKNLSMPDDSEAGGLHDLILNNLNFDALRKFPGPVYAMCTPLDPAEYLKTGPVAFDLTKKTNSEILNILLASSAIPFLFDEVSIDGKRYIDGGIRFFGDNVPVKPLYNDGFREFIVVYISLGKSGDVREFPDAAEFPGANITNILPGAASLKLLEKPASLVLFEKDYARALIECGYCDAVAQLSPMCEAGFAAPEYMAVFNECRADRDKFLRKRLSAALPRNAAETVLRYLRES